MDPGNDTTIRDFSLNISSNDTILNINRNLKKDENFNSILKNIKNIFRDNIQPLRENFNIDLYERWAREIRNNIINLRKMYFNLKKGNPSNNQSNNYQNTIVICPSTKNNSNANTDINTNANLEANSNTNKNIININTETNSNTNTNTNINTNTNDNIKINNIRNKINNLDLTIMSQQANKIVTITEPEGINGLYLILIEIVNFLLCYDDIFINYKNKSAFITLKLFLQIATLHFFKNIYKSDFIFCLMNKSCNILCQYNEMQKTDETIKKILTIEEKEIKKLQKYFKYDSELINKISKVIDKFNLNEKIDKINQDINSHKMFNNGEIVQEPKDDIQLKFDKLNQEYSILSKIQDSLGNDYKMFLKDSIRNELEQFNMLINKISNYEAPLIKQKFIDIIFRNKEVFKYLNENILYRHIPRKEINNFSLYPFNKNLSIYDDKYLITGKNILNILSIPLDPKNINEIMKDLEIFANEFLNKLANIKMNENEDSSENKNNKSMNRKGEKSESKSDDKKNGEGKVNEKSQKKFKKGALFTICEINYYHLVLFSYMIPSKIRDKEEFNRISALVSNNNFDEIYNILENLEGIELKGNYSEKENGKDQKKMKLLLFNYENVKKNNISFFLELKGEINEDKKKRKIEPFSQVEFCSILAKKLFEEEPIIIILTIVLKYWAIKRKIFKSDFTTNSRSRRAVLDDVVLLYFIYYFLMHKGIRKQKLFIRQYKNYSNERKEEKSNEKKEDKSNEKEDKSNDRKEDKSKEINIKNKGLYNKVVLLKELGELFIEFFWFIHELINLTDNNSEKEQERKLIIIDLSKKSIDTEKVTLKDIDEDGIPYSMRMEFDEGVSFYQMNRRETNILKKECTRALYFLLNRETNELFNQY